MEDVSFTVSEVAELPALAQKLIEFAGDERVVALNGAMGAGKTTFTKSFCQELESLDEVTSPTFGLVNEYLLPSGEKIYHFDFYRIEHEREAFDMGFEEYVYSGNWCLIEWPDKILNLLPDGYVKVTIEERNGLRSLTFRKQ